MEQPTLDASVGKAEGGTICGVAIMGDCEEGTAEGIFVCGETTVDVEGEGSEMAEGELSLVGELVVGDFVAALGIPVEELGVVVITDVGLGLLL